MITGPGQSDRNERVVCVGSSEAVKIYLGQRTAGDKGKSAFGNALINVEALTD